MQQTLLGKTGLSVSRFCLGTMMFGQMDNTDHRQCNDIIHRALDAGINFIDTADIYFSGEPEEIVGKALQAKREEVLLASKFHMPMGEEVYARGGSRKWIVGATPRTRHGRGHPPRTRPRTSTSYDPSSSAASYVPHLVRKIPYRDGICIVIHRASVCRNAGNPA